MEIEIPKFDNARILVVGDIMLDRYLYGSTSRISPEAPVPVVHVSESEDRPGGAGNVALNISAYGAKAILMGVTGADEASDALERTLSRERVDCHFERIEGITTAIKLRVMSRHQQLIRLDFEEGFYDRPLEGLEQSFKDSLAECDVVILSDYGKGTLRNCPELVKLARDCGKPVLVDPKGNDYSIYSGATLITPNLSEFEAVVGTCFTDEELVDKGQMLRDELNLDALLVTRSEKGMTLIHKDGVLHLPTRAKDVYDVTGAGDTVISTLAAALGSGLDLLSSTALANLAAGVVVGKLGTATASVSELREAKRDLYQIEKGILNPERLSELVKEVQLHGEKVVMTNGCFDILHAGHVTYLDQARKLGDHLIVAVNDDSSVHSLKGEGRPVNSLERRMAVLSALESVDWVVSFSDLTPEALICQLSPDFLVKGGDYTVDQIAGAECVINHGGKVVIMDFVDGISTTKILNEIRGVQD